MGLADSNGKVVEKIKYSPYGTPTYIYDNTSPQVDVVRTEAGNIVFRFSEPVNKDTAASAIKVRDGDSDISGTVTFADEDRVVIFQPSGALPNSLLTVIVETTLEDTFGNTLASEFNTDFTYLGTDTVIYDRVAPEVEEVIYKSGDFTITFDEEINSGSISDAVEIVSSQGTFTGTVTMLTSKTIKFDPDTSLSNGI